MCKEKKPPFKALTHFSKTMFTQTVLVFAAARKYTEAEFLTHASLYYCTLLQLIVRDLGVAWWAYFS